MTALTRADLLARYDEILARGLPDTQLAEWRRTGRFGAGVIVQSTSGSSGGGILRIPRAPADIAEVFSRTLVPYLSVFARPPARIAMLGGISHAEAALKMDLGGIGFRSFELGQLAELERFDPEVISCYPHIGRELYRDPRLKLPSLKAFKFGGEPLLDADLELSRRRFPGLAVFEQVGSTELPALAIGLREEGKPRCLPLQKKRFTFPTGPGGEWRPLIARDEFPALLFPVRDFYDTGDDALYDDAHLFDLRRRSDPDFDFLPLLDQLVRAGATNAQLDQDKRCLLVQGELAADEWSYRGVSYRIERAAPRRSPGSQKLKFLL